MARFRESGVATRSGTNGTVTLTIKARPRSYTAAMPTARDPSLPAPSLSSGGDQPCGLALFPVSLSLRMVEEMLAARGICVTYETVRQWGRREAGKAFADQVRQRACSRRQMAPWMRSSSRSPANHTGSGAPSIRTASILDVLDQRRRDTRAAQRLMKRLLKSAILPPRVMVTDKLRSTEQRAKMGLQVEHRQHKGTRQSRGELSCRPGGVNGSLKRFKSARQALGS